MSARKWRAVAVAALVAACTAAQPTPSPVSTPSPAPSATTPATLGPTATPIRTPMPTGSPIATATTAPSAVPPTPPPTPGHTEPTEPAPPAEAAGWVGPTRIGRGEYYSVSVAVDDAGLPHVVASIGDDNFYLTKAAGAWTRERLPRAPSGTYDWEQSLALDSDGSVWIAFTRFEGIGLGQHALGVFVTTNADGPWSAPERVVSTAHSPSLAVREGRAHVAYIAGEDLGMGAPMAYATMVDGSWVAQTVIDLASPAAYPVLRLGPSGEPIILATDHDTPLGGDKVLLASRLTSPGPFAVDRVSGTSHAAAATLALDDSGQPNVLWTTNTADDSLPLYHTQLSGGSWRPPALAAAAGHCGCNVPVLADVDTEGAVHLVFLGRGLLYATNRSGTFQSSWLSHSYGSADIAVDSLGRPHVVLTLDKPSKPTELLYTIGPGFQ